MGCVCVVGVVCLFVCYLVFWLLLFIFSKYVVQLTLAQYKARFIINTKSKPVSQFVLHFDQHKICGPLYFV